MHLLRVKLHRLPLHLVGAVGHAARLALRAQPAPAAALLPARPAAPPAALLLLLLLLGV